MVYVALLRGINVGGKNRVEMARLKAVFEKLGFNDVITYINSGNVVFSDQAQPVAKLIKQIEAGIEREFGFRVPVVVRDTPNIQAINKAVPGQWVDGAAMRTYVMFLWQDYDKEDVLESFTIKPGIDEVKYLPGAVVWRVDRQNITRSGMMKITGTELYKNITMRNINTVRKLASIMETYKN